MLRVLATRAAAWPARAPKAAFALAIAILAVALVGGSRIAIEADSSTAFDSPASRALDRIRRDLGAGEELFVLVAVTDDRGLPHLERFATALATDLARQPEFAPRATDALDLERLVREVVPTVGAAYLSAEEALAWWAIPSGELLDQRIGSALARADLPGVGIGDQLLELDPLGLAGPVLARLGSGGLPASMARGAMRSSDGRAMLVATAVRASSSDPAGARAAVHAARRAIAAQDPGGAYLACHIAGGHALAEESERIVRRDLVITLSTSLVLSLVLVGYGYSVGFAGALLLGIPVVWGTAVGVGLQGFLQQGGRVPAMALACAGVLIGIGIDFATHAVGEAAGKGPRELADVWPGLAKRLGLAALTTIGAFGSFALAGQPALRAMGAIATTGLVACWAGALLLLPALLTTRPFERVRARDLGAIPLAGWARRRPRLALGAIGVASVLAALAIAVDPPRLEDDLSRMHSASSPALLAQREIARHFGRAAEPLLLVLTGDSEDTVFEACHRLEPALRQLRADGQVAGHFSPAHLLPSQDEQEATAAHLAPVLDREMFPSRAGRAALARTISGALDANGLDATRYAGYVTSWVDELARATLWVEAMKLSEDHAIHDGAKEPALAVRDLDPTPLGPAMRSLLRATASGATAMIVVIPARPLWEESTREHLVGALEAALHAANARGDVTGMHVIASEAAALVAHDLLDVSAATVAIVVAILFVHFRRPGRVAVVLLPAALATVWTAGLLAATGVRLNMMNLGVLPLVLAIGVDDGIHLVDHWLDRTVRDIRAVVAHAGTAVVLTSATTMVSFGSLACSELAGLASVGWLVLFGVGAALVATLVALPALLGLAEDR